MSDNNTETLFNGLGGNMEDPLVSDFGQNSDDLLTVDESEEKSTEQKEDKSEDKTEDKSEEKKKEEKAEVIDIEEENTSGEADSESKEEKEENSSGASKSLQTFAKALIDEGQLSSIEEKDLENVKDFKDLSKLIEKEVKGREFSDLNDKQKELLEGLRNGIPADFMIQSMSNEEKLAEVSDEVLQENEDLQANLYLNDLISKGFDKERATRMVAKMKESEELFDEAKLALAGIKEREKSRRDNAVQNAQKQKDEFKQFVEKQEELIKGLPLSKEMKDRVYKSITNLEADENGQYIDKVIKTKNKDPKRFVATLHYLHELGVFKDDFDPSIFAKPAKKKTVEEFEKTLTSNNNTYQSMGNSTHAEIDENADKDLLQTIDSLF